MTIKATKPQEHFVTLVTLFFILAFGSALGSQADCRAQEKERTPVSRPPAQSLDEPGITSALAEVKEDYRISAGDVIEVLIDRAPELSGTKRVSVSGTIIMEYLGRIAAQEKTPEELAKFIADGLRGRYLKNPRVSVIVKQINSHVFFIQGAVNRPGAYQIEGRPSLLTLITVAGGLTENHGSTAFIIRETKQSAGQAGTVPDLKVSSPSPQSETPTASPRSQFQDADSDQAENDRYELLKVSINGLFRGDFDKNMYIEPRSIVHIPHAEVFFVAGEVNAPGSFQFREGTTLRQAISLAQGTKFKADTASAIIFREDQVSRKRLEVKVDVGKVMSGKHEDVAILANDIIIVPNSRLKSVGGAFLTAVGLNSARIPRY